MKSLQKYVILALCLLILVNCEEQISEVFISSIEIEGDYIVDGGSTQLTAVILPENASNKEVDWSVSNETIAQIDQNGLLTALSNGSLTVTATSKDGSGVFGKRIIGVSGVFVPPVLVESIEVVGPNVIDDGNSRTYAINVLPINADNKEVTWSVTDASIASIDQNGQLNPVKNGTIDIIVTANDGSAVSGSLPVTISGVEMIDDGVLVNTAAEILEAISNAQPGDIIYVAGGTYFFNSTIRMSRDGQEGTMIVFRNNPNDSERPLFDFSAMSENSQNRGISLSADYWHVKGIDVYKAGDNGMNISGSNNLIEFCTFYENADSGLQIGSGGANNTILNCDSYFNADSTIENADGFAAKLDCGDGNKFIGCRAWNNLDDGWDGYLRGADNITTFYENCWSFRNGYMKNGTLGGGDGNGFKTGGSDDKTLKHHANYSNCIAAGNSHDGFDHNSNRGAIIIHNSSAHANGTNINFGSTNIASSLTIKNSLSFDGNGGDKYLASVTDVTNNSWQNSLLATADDFVSVNMDLLLAPRKADGSLPDIDYLSLKSGSDLIDKGIDVGLEFSGAAPDLGAFEYGGN